jgi:hypothetical protein
MKAASGKPVRCAIYTRVSTDQGLEQDFNSLDGPSCDPSMTMAASQAAISNVLPCDGSWRTSGRVKST